VAKSRKHEAEDALRHIAIIMDGNGRWARRHGLARRHGHREGVESVRVITRECARRGVEQLTLFAFSTENWMRPSGEVRFLMGLLRRFLVSERAELMENNIRFKAIGRLEELPGSVREALDKSVAMTASNPGMILRLALNYGGRQEMLDAAKALAKKASAESLDPARLTMEDLRACLYDPAMTDPDLLIRTGGETRLSNFLLWQLSYAELWFTKTCWPAFRVPQLDEAFRAYAQRERRYGALSKSAQGHPRSASSKLD